MTKCIVLGEAKSKEPKKAIKFVKTLCTDLTIENTQWVPAECKAIELICKNYSTDATILYDLMFAYNTIRDQGVLIIGHWNDGIV